MSVRLRFLLLALEFSESFIRSNNSACCCSRCDRYLVLLLLLLTIITSIWTAFDAFLVLFPFLLFVVFVVFADAFPFAFAAVVAALFIGGVRRWFVFDVMRAACARATYRLQVELNPTYLIQLGVQWVL